jgi:multisubunit Na+/H+ antiporter MnhE subunit
VSGLLVRAAALAAVYLLVLTSVAPGDLLTGGVLGGAVAVALRPHRRQRRAAPVPRRARAAATVLGETAVETIRGSWRVARFCLGAPANPGLVEIPREDRSRVEVAVWGVVTGVAPDEVVVDVDERRGVLVVHVLDAHDPEAVRVRHRDAHERRRW